MELTKKIEDIVQRKFKGSFKKYTKMLRLGDKMNGLNEKSRRRIAEALEKVLADTYALFLKTQNYHWNVTGDFNDLHEMFEKQYEELYGDVDDIAERIRALGFKINGTFTRFKDVTTVEDGIADKEDGEMTKDLADSHAHLISNLREVAGIASEEKDFATVNFISELSKAREKTLWMLRAKSSTDNSKVLK